MIFRNKIKPAITSATASLMLLSAFSASALVPPPAITAGGSGMFTGITTILVDIYTVMTGPFALALSGVALAMAAMIWAIGSRGEEGLGRVSRVVIASLILLNIPALITSLKALG